MITTGDGTSDDEMSGISFPKVTRIQSRLHAPSPFGTESVLNPRDESDEA
jgi:hypothetical protein